MRTPVTLWLTACLALVGCRVGSNRPLDPSPIPARGGVSTEGGYQLQVEPDGSLVARPDPADLEAALGARLETDGGDGVVVRELIGEPSDGGLRVGDRILRALAVPPGAAQLPPLGIERQGAAVGAPADLAAYPRAVCELDLLVRRQVGPGDEQTVVARRSFGEPELVAARAFFPTETRAQGFEAIRVDDLPERFRPRDAEVGRGDLLVTYLSVESPLAIKHGVRPLDRLVPQPLSDSDIPPQLRAQRDRLEEARRLGRVFFGRYSVFTPPGELRGGIDLRAQSFYLISVAAPEAVFALDDSPVNTDVMIGPAGLGILAVKEQLGYDPSLDDFRRTSEFSLLPLTLLRVSLLRLESSALERAPGTELTIRQLGPLGSEDVSALLLPDPTKRAPFTFFPTLAELRANPR